MARLLVKAVTGESDLTDAVWEILVDVSVSRADDGSSVTGLAAKNFRVASSLGSVYDFKVGTHEWKWEPQDTEPAGCYELGISITPAPQEFVKGQIYQFGIQVRTFDESRPPKVIDQGQTIVALTSRGK